MEIRLLNRSLSYGNFALQSKTSCKRGAALELCFDAFRINRDAAVHNKIYFRNPDFVIGVDNNFYHAGDISEKASMCREALTASFRQTFSPTRFFFGRFDHL